MSCAWDSWYGQGKIPFVSAPLVLLSWARYNELTLVPFEKVKASAPGWLALRPLAYQPTSCRGTGMDLCSLISSPRLDTLLRSPEEQSLGSALVSPGKLTTSDCTKRAHPCRQDQARPPRS
ncbi:hypothetical protein J3459_016056 [Metarhizium acridum]|uniref:uncharacterized protein n=1 Tax=Metarhizium acridum TaxID=92637 RepID=UPI001C6B3E1D|nr:hypothetical protein J3458_020386 [Metarhizium acridum]KAG8412043.1 hypothetical protein J3459_016056 [Metarhizium acridum]